MRACEAFKRPGNLNNLALCWSLFPRLLLIVCLAVPGQSNEQHVFEYVRLGSPAFTGPDSTLNPKTKAKETIAEEETVQLFLCLCFVVDCRGRFISLPSLR